MVRVDLCCQQAACVCRQRQRQQHVGSSRAALNASRRGVWPWLGGRHSSRAKLCWLAQVQLLVVLAGGASLHSRRTSCRLPARCCPGCCCCCHSLHTDRGQQARQQRQWRADSKGRQRRRRRWRHMSVGQAHPRCRLRRCSRRVHSIAPLAHSFICLCAACSLLQAAANQTPTHLSYLHALLSQ